MVCVVCADAYESVGGGRREFECRPHLEGLHLLPHLVSGCLKLVRSPFVDVSRALVLGNLLVVVGYLLLKLGHLCPLRLHLLIVVV